MGVTGPVMAGTPPAEQLLAQVGGLPYPNSPWQPMEMTLDRRVDEGRLPASYANFYFTNQALLVPTFGVDQDAEALAILESVVRDRPVVSIRSENLLLGLGAVHCVTQQEPVEGSEGSEI